MKKFLYMANVIGLLGFFATGLNGDSAWGGEYIVNEIESGYKQAVPKELKAKYETAQNEAKKTSRSILNFINKTNKDITIIGTQDNLRKSVRCVGWQSVTIKPNASYKHQADVNCIQNTAFQIRLSSDVQKQNLQQVELDTKGLANATIPYTNNFQVGRTYNIEITGSQGKWKATLLNVE